jgi:hypothetical protein
MTSGQDTLPQACEHSSGLIDTGDHVHHNPSGEDWVVAYVRGEHLVACGWPHSMARLADCHLIKKASEASRDDLLQCMARGNNNDYRTRYARERLALLTSGQQGRVQAAEASGSDEQTPSQKRVSDGPL